MPDSNLMFLSLSLSHCKKRNNYLGETLDFPGSVNSKFNVGTCSVKVLASAAEGARLVRFPDPLAIGSQLDNLTRLELDGGRCLSLPPLHSLSDSCQEGKRASTFCQFHSRLLVLSNVGQP